MNRPPLNEIPLDWTEILSPGCSITMSPDQWDTVLKVAYDLGWTLIEVDETEIPVAAYRKTLPS